MRAIKLFFTLMFFLCAISISQAATATSYVIKVHGEVDLVMARYVERSIALAESVGARAIIIDIDTPGGRVDAALSISGAIMRTSLPTIALVTGQAWSAGALIALSARNLYMISGTAIGAAEPIPTTEKIVAAWRSAMEGAAEHTGRDPSLAAAMVDRDVQIPGVIEQGKLLSLSAQSAVELGLVDGLANSVEDALTKAQVGDVGVSFLEETGTDRIARTLTTPSVSIILLTLGLAGIIIEVTTIGFGIPGVIGLLSLSLYFGSSIIAGQASGLVLILFIAGLGLLILEAFIPGFGVAGITGILTVIASIVMAAGDTRAGLQAVTLALIASVLLLLLAWRLMARRKLLERVSLRARATTEEGYLSGPNHEELIGRTGWAITALRPSGIVEIAEQRFSVVTDGNYIPAGAAIKVQKVIGQRIVVDFEGK